MTRWHALGLLLAASTALGADDALRQQVEQSVRLGARLVGDAATGQRIAASGHTRAAALLEDSRLHLARAEKALAEGDLPTARQEAEEALRQIGLARRLVPDGVGRQAVAQQRWARQQATLERLLQAWPAPAEGAAPRDSADAEDRRAVTTLLADARRLAGEGRHDEANTLLGTAETRLMAGMNRVLHQRTLDYSSKATTPAEVFYETLARHEGLIELVPVALAELKPGADAQALVERYADTSRTLRLQAVQRQQRGDLTQALADLHNALIYVQRALAAAGVALPAPVE